MADPIMRDVDIVSQAGAFGAVETATRTANGSAITVTSSANTNNTNGLANAVTAAGANSTVILSGDFSSTSQISLAAGQSLIGGGSVTVRSASGRTAVLTMPGATLTDTNTTNNVGAITMANNSMVSGLTITRTYSPSSQNNYGIVADGVSGVTIANTTVTVQSTSNSTAQGIRVINSSDVTLTGNTVTARSSNAPAVALQLGGVTTLTASGNSFSATQGTNTVGIGNGLASTGITLRNNNIEASGSVQNNTALQFNGDTTGSLSGNTLTATGGLNARAMESVATVTMTVSGNTLSASGGSGVNRIVDVSGGTFTANAGSTGNLRNGGTCSNAATFNGTVDFTNGTSCP